MYGCDKLKTHFMVANVETPNHINIVENVGNDFELFYMAY